MQVFGDAPRFCAIGRGIEAFRQFTANLAGSDLRLRIGKRAFCVTTREVRIHRINIVELPVAADVIVVRLGVQHYDREFREFFRDLADIADAHAGVEEQGFFLAENEVGNGFLGLVRLVDRQGPRGGLVNLEPRIRNRHALEGFVFGPGERLAPVGNLGGADRDQEQQKDHTSHGYCREDRRLPRKAAATSATAKRSDHGWVIFSGLTISSNSSGLRWPSCMAASRKLMCCWCAVWATLAALS